jgi:Flp pilus assembly protein TadD
MTAKTRKQQLEEMLAEDPNDPFLRYGLAMEHVSAGDLDAAVRCFRELFAVAPDYVPAYLQAGQTLTRLGRTAEARDVYRQGMAVAARRGDEHARGEMEAFLDSLE